MLANKKGKGKAKKDVGKGKGKGKGKKGPVGASKIGSEKPNVVENDSKKQEPEEEEVLDKAQKIKVDRDQIYGYLEKARDLKSQQIADCLEVVRQSNNCELGMHVLNYQDLTLSTLLIPVMKLVKIPSTRFCCQNFL